MKSMVQGVDGCRRSTAQRAQHGCFFLRRRFDQSSGRRERIYKLAAMLLCRAGRLTAPAWLYRAALPYRDAGRGPVVGTVVFFRFEI